MKMLKIGSHTGQWQGPLLKFDLPYNYDKVFIQKLLPDHRKPNSLYETNDKEEFFELDKNNVTSRYFGGLLTPLVCLDELTLNNPFAITNVFCTTKPLYFFEEEKERTKQLVKECIKEVLMEAVK